MRSKAVPLGSTHSSDHSQKVLWSSKRAARGFSNWVRNSTGTVSRVYAQRSYGPLIGQAGGRGTRQHEGFQALPFGETCGQFIDRAEIMPTYIIVWWKLVRFSVHQRTDSERGWASVGPHNKRKLKYG
jgi:hypothetical protein